MKTVHMFQKFNGQCSVEGLRQRWGTRYNTTGVRFLFHVQAAMQWFQERAVKKKQFRTELRLHVLKTLPKRHRTQCRKKEQV